MAELSPQCLRLIGKAVQVSFRTKYLAQHLNGSISVVTFTSTRVLS